MTTIAGASRFLVSATLANARGQSAVQPDFLNSSVGAPDILEIGRRNFDNGIGLSSSARALNRKFLEETGSAFNQIHSLAVSASGDTFALQQSILALRARLPDSAISEGVASFGQEEERSSGSNVDIEA